MAVLELTGMATVASMTARSDLRGPKVGYEARGVEWTAIGVEGDGRGAQRGEGVGDSFNDVLIYAGCILEGGVKGAGRDRSGSNSLDTQAPGISRRMLPSSEAIVQVTRSSQCERKGWCGGGNG